MPDKRAGIKTLYVLAAAFGAFLLAGGLLRHTLSALLTSLVISYLFNPLLKYVEKRGFDRITAIALLYGIAALALMFLSVVLIPYIGYQVDALTNEMPRYLQHVKNVLEEWKETLTPYYSGKEGAWLVGRAGESLTRLGEEVSGLGYERLKGVLF